MGACPRNRQFTGKVFISTRQQVSHFAHIRNMLSRPERTFTLQSGQYAAGHTPFTGSWSATLARSGQVHTWRAQTTLASPGRKMQSRPMWDERIPVWEQRIPEYASSQRSPFRSPMKRSSASLVPFTTLPSEAKSSSTVPRDWSLLLAPGSGKGIRRPWPEYEPESSAAVGRRWNGTNVGRLYEHVRPSDLPVSTSVNSLSPDAGY